MAKQDYNPPPWNDSMSDGCSGVLDLGYSIPCRNHDRAFHYGGTVRDKKIADWNLYIDMWTVKGFWGWVARRGLARVRYWGVRWLTYNYPPWDPARVKFPFRLERFNWLGPGSPDKLDESDLRSFAR